MPVWHFYNQRLWLAFGQIKPYVRKLLSVSVAIVCSQLLFYSDRSGVSLEEGLGGPIRILELRFVMELASTLYNRISEAFGNPYIVKEVPASEYSKLSPIELNSPLFLYKHKHIDCVLLHPNRNDTMIRIFRLAKSDLSLAKVHFRSLSSHIPEFYRNFQEWYTTNKLTNLSELIRKYESWSSVHIAVQAGLQEFLTAERSGHIINNQFCEKARSPMHLACTLNQLDILEKCVLIGGDLSLQDEKGDTVLHYAVRNNTRPFINFLTRNMCEKTVNIQNIYGETALHVAIEARKFEFAKLLILKGCDLDKCSKIGYPIHYSLKHANNDFTSYLLSLNPKQVNYACAKHKSLPIHWSKTAEDVRVLVEHSSDLSYMSSTCDTPLHIMVLKNRLDAAIGLIFQHADINVKGKDGNTALHLAIKNDNAKLVKMLLLFGADCKIKNDFGETPGLFAFRSAKSNKEKIVGLLSAVGGIVVSQHDGTDNMEISSVGKFLDDSKASKAKILCLDGGGIRGLILTQILIAIEEMTGKQCREVFDWIGGTSTGGILALALCQGIKAVDCQSIYFRLKDRVFVGSRPYDSGPMESFLKDVFGENITFADIPPNPKVVVTSVLANQRPAKLHLFRNYEPLHNFSTRDKAKVRSMKKTDSLTIEEMHMDPLKTPLWQAARSSGAAPTYFRPMGVFVDGGLMANNPTVDMLTEIFKYNKGMRQSSRHDEIKQPGLVVSVGTGIVPAIKVKSVDIILPSGPNPLTLVSSAMAGLELTQVMVDAATETNAHVDDRAEAWCGSIDAAYYRLQPHLKEDVMINEVNDEKLVDMLWTTKMYVQKNKHLIQEIADILLS